MPFVCLKLANWQKIKEAYGKYTLREIICPNRESNTKCGKGPFEVLHINMKSLGAGVGKWSVRGDGGVWNLKHKSNLWQCENIGFNINDAKSTYKTRIGYTTSTTYPCTPESINGGEGIGIKSAAGLNLNSGQLNTSYDAEFYNCSIQVYGAKYSNTIEST